MTRKERFTHVINWFQENAESSETELHYGNNFQLLIVVILSAQCTDKRVNQDHTGTLRGISNPGGAGSIIAR